MSVGGVKNPNIKHPMGPVSYGGRVALCSSWITAIRRTPGNVCHPFKQVPPATGFYGLIHSFISGFLTLTVSLNRGVYYTGSISHTTTVMSSPRTERIQEVPAKGPLISLFIDDVLTFSRRKQLSRLTQTRLQRARAQRWWGCGG